jgi:hypothetical protein
MSICYYCGLYCKSQGGLTNHQHSCSTKKWVERLEQKEKMEKYAQQRVQEYIQMETTRRLDRVSSGFVQLSNDFKLLDQRVDQLLVDLEQLTVTD